MKTVGILTYHFADNFGAIIQAYSLQRAFSKFNSCHASIIDYIPFGFSYEKRYGDAVEKDLFLEKRKKFESFLKDNCILSQKCSMVPDGLFDIYCVGSDQVWNTSNPRPAYFLGDVSDDITKCSFASSVSLSNNSPNIKKELFEQHISKFKYVSVRETESVNLIRELTQKDCERMCDPTVLLEDSDLENIESESKRNQEYILFFWLLNDENVFSGIEFVNRISREYNLPILHSLYGKYSKYINQSIGSMYYDTPGDFLTNIKNASIVVTNSYHVTLFSMRYHKKFFILPGSTMKTRFDTLNNIYGIEKCIRDNANNDIEPICLNYDEIDQILKEEQNRGYNYISKIIED